MSQNSSRIFRMRRRLQNCRFGRWMNSTFRTKQAEAERGCPHGHAEDNATSPNDDVAEEGPPSLSQGRSHKQAQVHIPEGCANEEGVDGHDPAATPQISAKTAQAKVLQEQSAPIPNESGTAGVMSIIGTSSAAPSSDTRSHKDDQRSERSTQSLESISIREALKKNSGNTPPAIPSAYTLAKRRRIGPQDRFIAPMKVLVENDPEFKKSVPFNGRFDCGSPYSLTYRTTVDEIGSGAIILGDSRTFKTPTLLGLFDDRPEQGVDPVAIKHIFFADAEGNIYQHSFWVLEDPQYGQRPFDFLLGRDFFDVYDFSIRRSPSTDRSLHITAQNQALDTVLNLHHFRLQKGNEDSKILESLPMSGYDNG